MLVKICGSNRKRQRNWKIRYDIIGRLSLARILKHSTFFWNLTTLVIFKDNEVLILCMLIQSNSCEFYVDFWIAIFQYEAQQSQLKTASDQLKRYLNVIHGQSATPKTANDVIKHLTEEIQV